mmetsp:Transcript_74617/g.241258  ORF Transcript_74617/g.241258 Transcript_74617/m.241258 type:complete len:226 (+) Transcript_74617:392-1069(+)
MSVSAVAGGKEEPEPPPGGGSAGPAWSAGVPGGRSSSQRMAALPAASCCRDGGAAKMRGRPLAASRLVLRLPLARSPVPPCAPPLAGSRTQFSKRARNVFVPRLAGAAEVEDSPPRPTPPRPPAPAPPGSTTSPSSGSALKHCETSRYTDRLPSERSQLNQFGTETGLLTCTSARFITSSSGLPSPLLPAAGVGKSTYWPLVTSQRESWLHASRTRTCRLPSSTL